MSSNKEYRIANIFDYLDTKSMEFILNDISCFKSNQNDDVENFLKNNAISFCRLKQSAIYLLYDKKDNLVAYFTLAFKILDLPLGNMSNTLLKQVERFGQRNDNVIQLPCVLVAQLSKNYICESVIDGVDLMKHLNAALLQIQRLVGGGFVFLECEKDKIALLEKYKSYGFISVNERLSSTSKPLVQFIKKI